MFIGVGFIVVGRYCHESCKTKRSLVATQQGARKEDRKKGTVQSRKQWGYTNVAS